TCRCDLDRWQVAPCRLHHHPPLIANTWKNDDRRRRSLPTSVSIGRRFSRHERQYVAHDTRFPLGLTGAMTQRLQLNKARHKVNDWLRPVAMCRAELLQVKFALRSGYQNV